MIKREGQRLDNNVSGNYPAIQEMIDGQLVHVNGIMRTSLLNIGFEKMWELLSEEERNELKSVVLDKETIKNEGKKRLKAGAESKPSSNPNRKKMYVDVHASFEDLHRRNKEAIKMLEKRDIWY